MSIFGEAVLGAFALWGGISTLMLGLERLRSDRLIRMLAEKDKDIMQHFRQAYEVMRAASDARDVERESSNKLRAEVRELLRVAKGQPR